MTKILAFANHKGGVGKTTSTINVGAALALQNKKVLAIDLDPQANLTQSLGIKDTEYNIYEALKGRQELMSVMVVENFNVVASVTDLAAIEVELSTAMDREFFLKDLLDPIKKHYDYILIDCPPSLSLLTLNAFTAADEIIIPLQSEYLATMGLSKIVEIKTLINKRLNPSLAIGGVFLTQYDGRKLLSKNVHEIIQSYFGADLFETKVRNNVSLAEAPAFGQDIFRYNPKSVGAEDYKALSEEIIKRHSK